MNKRMEIVYTVFVKHYETNYKDTSTTPHADLKMTRKIKKLHKTYVFVPADKAANNSVVVCRKY